MNLFVATNGKDTWSGTTPSPNEKLTDGPFLTIRGAFNKIRELKCALPGDFTPVTNTAKSTPITIFIRGGRYQITEPIIITDQDSFPVTIAPYQDEKPIIDGATKIGNWEITKINGRTAWQTNLPKVKSGKWDFRELYVNGKRAARPRFPETGLFRMESAPDKSPHERGHTRFVAADNNIKPFTNLTDIEVVYVHLWIEERSHIEDIDYETRTVSMVRPSHRGLVAAHGNELATYYFDNVFEELKKPGQWYLDRSTGNLYYIPRPGETPENTEVYAPTCYHKRQFLGNPEENRFVEFIRITGLTFRHTDWRHPSYDGADVIGSSDPATPKRLSRGKSAAASQSARDVPGIITMEGARNIAIENCTIELGGWYGVEIGDGCRSVRVCNNIIRTLGAGGVKIDGASAKDNNRKRETSYCVISDNEITNCGRVFHSAVGILSMNAYGMIISHNHIHDLFYSGISCGWVWGYAENISRDNLIENNHIHNIGQGLLSDMGGIYTLGVQPGTVIRGNHIYDIRSADYGGWCIYPDEGSSHIIIENNLCYDADRQPFHQHYGRENIVRNNIFAFGGESLATYSRTDEHNGVTFTNNIFVSDGKPVYTTGYRHDLKCKRFISDLNFFFDTKNDKIYFQNASNRLTLREWQAIGQDKHSIVADPGFVNLKKRNFKLKKNSPALKIGFIPFDITNAGPRQTES